MAEHLGYFLKSTLLDISQKGGNEELIGCNTLSNGNLINKLAGSTEKRAPGTSTPVVPTVQSAFLFGVQKG
ncbi:uncharacterized protein VTP21DRAFT_8188 [Calcarisporiella thermophila]|uniref:uncharacterized protein n=1 Tax=Calcarisporiella thermophila TaxID=911321 RepID=UPI0037448A7F